MSFVFNWHLFILWDIWLMSSSVLESLFQNLSRFFLVVIKQRLLEEKIWLRTIVYRNNILEYRVVVSSLICSSKMSPYENFLKESSNASRLCSCFSIKKAFPEMPDDFWNLRRCLRGFESLKLLLILFVRLIFSSF